MGVMGGFEFFGEIAAPEPFLALRRICLPGLSRVLAQRGHHVHHGLGCLGDDLKLYEFRIYNPGRQISCHLPTICFQGSGLVT